MRILLVASSFLAAMHGILRALAATHSVRLFEMDLLLLEALQLMLAVVFSFGLSLWVWQATRNIQTFHDRALRCSPAIATALVAIPGVQLVGWWFVLDEIAVLSRRDDKKRVAWYSIASASWEVTLWYYLTGLAIALWMFLPLPFAAISANLARSVNGCLIAAQILAIASAWACDRMMRRVGNDQAERSSTVSQ
jgi:hypothetical protein